MSISEPTPPIAARKPTVHAVHGDERVDDYHWLRDRENPEVRAYLEAENAYADAVMAGKRDLRDTIYSEIVGRVLETDRSAPVRHGPWRYYFRTVEGLQYPIHCRIHDSGGEEQVLLDENVLSEGHAFFALEGFAVSPDHRLLAYAIDAEGDEVYTLRVRDLDQCVDLGDEIPHTGGNVAWALDNRTLYYTTLDEAHRAYRCWRHQLGVDPAGDRLVFEEPDEHFWLSIRRTRSDDLLVLHLGSKVTSEVWTLPAGDPDADFTIVRPRRHGVEYSVEHHGDRLLIVTNDGAPDFRLMEAPLSDPSAWRELIGPRPDVKLDQVAAFADHLVFVERAGGSPRLRVYQLSTASEHVIDQPEDAHDVWLERNPEFATSLLRYGYTSLRTPTSVFAYDLVTRERTLLKQQPVLGGYDPTDYVTERLWASAPDGTRVPMTMVCKVGTPRDGSAPAVLYGYGAYEIAIDPYFSSARLSLLERGVVFAIAHVRGGGDLGRHWYEGGKLHAKPNTFTDFIACAEHLVACGWTSPTRLAIRGGSAGGLLLGAVMNSRPDLFRAAVAQVPFADVLTTILDASLPLTVGEWEEWGNPQELEFYRTIKSYSPYDNVRSVRYPDLLVTSGLHDVRVSYWEPAKWVAKLRATTVGNPRILLKTEMGAGHGGPSGRYDAWREEAFVLAFILDRLGVSR
ncbi:MAG: S9 family peptidase [Egibacteraceae bacterium]